jgi:hypothetical protein
LRTKRTCKIIRRKKRMKRMKRMFEITKTNSRTLLMIRRKEIMQMDGKYEKYV